MENTQNKKKIGGFIFAALVLLILIVLFVPALRSLLPAAVAAPVGAFVADHFGKSMFAAITLRMLGAALLVLVLAWALAGVIKFFAGLVKLQGHRAETLRQLVSKILVYAVWIIGIILALQCLGVDTTAIFVSAGVLGIIVGFGAQSLIEDIITGLFIILEGEIAVGDIITIDGFRGEVKTIGLRTVSIVDLGGNIRIINNSEISSLVNLSDITSVAVVNVPVSVSHSLESAEAAVKQALTELPSEYPDVFQKAPVYKGVDVLGEEYYELMVVADVAEENVYNARRIMQREIRIAFEQAALCGADEE